MKLKSVKSVLSCQDDSILAEIESAAGTDNEGEGGEKKHLFVPMSLRPKYVTVDMDVSQSQWGRGIEAANVDCLGEKFAIPIIWDTQVENMMLC